MQKTKSRKVVDMLSLSFCQRMEIGFFAEAITFQKAEKLEGATFDEIQANKNFKFTGMQAVLSYVPVCHWVGVVGGWVLTTYLFHRWIQPVK